VRQAAAPVGQVAEVTFDRDALQEQTLAERRLRVFENVFRAHATRRFGPM
jgi:hypothetical protein